MDGEDDGEYTLVMDLEGEKESVGSDMKPCLIIADTSLDFNAFSAAIEALREELVAKHRNILDSLGNAETRTTRKLDAFLQIRSI